MPSPRKISHGKSPVMGRREGIGSCRRCGCLWGVGISPRISPALHTGTASTGFQATQSSIKWRCNSLWQQEHQKTWSEPEGAVGGKVHPRYRDRTGTKRTRREIPARVSAWSIQEGKTPPSTAQAEGTGLSLNGAAGMSWGSQVRLVGVIKVHECSQESDGFQW